MKLIIQNNRIAGTATDEYTGPDEFITAPGDYSSDKQYNLIDGIIVTPTMDEIKAQQWNLIKLKRDQLYTAGYKVGTNWFHSDADSRIQQLALVAMGAGIPAGLQWKCLGGAFVTMTPTLAGEILAAAGASDAAIFSAAETHKAAMEAADDPMAYSFESGWPVGYA